MTCWTTTPPASYNSGSKTAGTTATASTSPRSCWRSSRRVGHAGTWYRRTTSTSKWRTISLTKPGAGIEEFKIPSIFGNRLFEFQTAAVKIAAHHLNRRNGVLIGDVVGLGKTLIATAVARIFEDDLGTQTLIICPKNLVRMWEEYRDQYGLRARVLSIRPSTWRATQSAALPPSHY